MPADVPIPHHVLTDTTLSMRARTMYGLLVEMGANHRDGITTSVVDVTKRTKLGRGTVDNTLKELERARYLVRSQIHENGRYSGTRYLLHRNRQ